MNDWLLLPTVLVGMLIGLIVSGGLRALVALSTMMRDTRLRAAKRRVAEAAGEIDRLQIENQSLATSFPDPKCLRLLIKWINHPRMREAFPGLEWDNTEIQDDLKKWALAAEAAEEKT